MPRGDGTGPAGLGPTTGRAAGYCAGYGAPGFMNPAPGRGFWGRGGGRGRRNWFHATGLSGWARDGWGMPAWGMGPQAGPEGPYGAAPIQPPAPGEELDALKGQAGYLEDALEGIRKRMSELEAKEKK